MKKIMLNILISITFINCVDGAEITKFKSEWKVNGVYTERVNNNNIISSIGNGINGLVATKIYENGGLFCPTRITNDGGEFSYRRQEFSSCRTICRDGYIGAECELKQTQNICADINYESVFANKISTLNGYDENISNSVNIFGKGSKYDHYVMEGEGYYTDMLSIIEFIPNGVKVAPVEFRTTGQNYAGAIVALSSPNFSVLCARGYKLKNDKCVRPADCKKLVPKLKIPGKQVDSGNDEDNITFCSGYDGYKSSEHDLIEGDCYSFVCKNGGFKEGTKDCIPCTTTRKQGINDNGECIQCKEDNKMFKDGRCVGYYTYDKKDLVKGIIRAFDCWREMSGDYYSTCVKCKGTFNTTTKECEQ